MLIYIFLHHNLLGIIMKIEKVNTTVGQILSVKMIKDESFYVEPGALVCVDGEFEMKSELSGGIGASAMRMIGGGENLFLNRIVSKGEIEIKLAAEIPGEYSDIKIIENEGYILGDCVYVCHEGDVKVSSKWGGLSAFTTGSGLMFLHVTGNGTVYVHGAEAIFVKEVNEGETFYLDNKCFIACRDNVKFEKIFAGSNLLTKVAGGEGIMLKFKGPCKVYYQTESPSGLAKLLSKYFRR
jgi:uncharacterized protein (TIGR00266 family)